MHRKLCIIHANCQGEELETLLTASPEFRQIYRIERYTNYIKEPIPASSLQNCELFLYQHLGASWGSLASTFLLAQLAASSTHLVLPNLFFNGYWPTWTRNSPIDFGDFLLDRLIDEGSQKSVILSIYLHKDISHFIDLQASLNACIERERVKEQNNFVRILPLVLEEWKSSMLYYTINHPGKKILLYIANKLLASLCLPPLHDTSFATLRAQGDIFPSYADFELPIHPQVAAFHGLTFVTEDKKYNIFGRQLTFEQYVSRYIDFRQSGFSEGFLAYLQLV